MELYEDKLSKIEELATMLTPVEQVAVLLSIDPHELTMLVRDKTTQVSIAYRRGVAQTALELRAQEIELAKSGSPLAVQLAHSYLKNLDLDE